MSTESSGSDCSRVCVHVRVCMCSHARVHICVCDYCQKRKIPPLVQGGKPTKSQNPKESAIVLKHRRDQARGEPASELVAMGNITQFSLPVLGMHVACCLQAHSLKYLSKDHRHSEGGHPSSRSKSI